MPLVLSLMHQLSSSSPAYVLNTGMQPLLWAARPLASGGRSEYSASCSCRLLALSVLRGPAQGRSAGTGGKNARSAAGCDRRHVVAAKSTGGSSSRRRVPVIAFAQNPNTSVYARPESRSSPGSETLLPLRMVRKASTQASSKHSGSLSNTARPNPSIEGTASSLRPPAAPHVKR
jgi:hypothetical protein